MTMLKFNFLLWMMPKLLQRAIRTKPGARTTWPANVWSSKSKPPTRSAAISASRTAR